MHKDSASKQRNLSLREYAVAAHCCENALRSGAAPSAPSVLRFAVRAAQRAAELVARSDVDAAVAVLDTNVSSTKANRSWQEPVVARVLHFCLEVGYWAHFLDCDVLDVGVEGQDGDSTLGAARCRSARLMRPRGRSVRVDSRARLTLATPRWRSFGRRRRRRLRSPAGIHLRLYRLTATTRGLAARKLQISLARWSRNESTRLCSCPNEASGTALTCPNTQALGWPNAEGGGTFV